VSATARLEEARWVVVDCETSGLDPKRDRLLSVGAVAVRGERIDLGETYAALVGQAEPSAPQNILIHGIGGDRQRSGRAASEVLPELWHFVSDATPCAFHASFDAEVLRRAAPAHARRERWLDLAELAPALFAAPAGPLDEWLARFGIEPVARHDALGDAFSTAQLMLVLLAEARRQGMRTSRELFSLLGQRRWLR
jgi:DNA polymerase-3 subunit epsilon